MESSAAPEEEEEDFGGLMVRNLIDRRIISLMYM
jgi:hypothetical protein